MTDTHDRYHLSLTTTAMNNRGIQRIDQPRHDDVSTHDQQDKTRYLDFPQTSGDGESSKNTEIDPSAHHLVYGIADILKAKLNSQGNDSFTFGFEKSDSKLSLSNNGGLPSSFLNDEEKKKEVDKLFKLRDNRSIQRQGSGYTSPPKPSITLLSDKFLRSSMSRDANGALKLLSIPLDIEKDDDISEDSCYSKDLTPPNEIRKKHVSVKHQSRFRDKLDEDRMVKSPSTFKQRYLESKLLMSETSDFIADDEGMLKNRVDHIIDKTIDLLVFTRERINKSKVAFKQYCEIRDTPAVKNYNSLLTSKGPSPMKHQKVMLPPTPEKSNTNMSMKRTPWHSRTNVDLDMPARHTPDPYACFKHKSNSHDYDSRAQRPVDRLCYRLAHTVVIDDGLKDRGGAIDVDARSENSDDKSMFSEFSDLKKSHATDGRQSTTRSAIVFSRNSPKHKNRRSEVKKSLNEVLEVTERSVSQDAGSSSRKQVDYPSFNCLSTKTLLFIGLFVALLIEAIILIQLSEE